MFDLDRVREPPDRVREFPGPDREPPERVPDPNQCCQWQFLALAIWPSTSGSHPPTRQALRKLSRAKLSLSKNIVDLTLEWAAQYRAVLPNLSCASGPSVCLIMLPAPGPGFRGQFWAGFGQKASACGPNSGSKLPGPKAQAVWERISNCSPELVLHER